jgi:hypothetical protein
MVFLGRVGGNVPYSRTAAPMTEVIDSTNNKNSPLPT